MSTKPFANKGFFVYRTPCGEIRSASIAESLSLDVVGGVLIAIRDDDGQLRYLNGAGSGDLAPTADAPERQLWQMIADVTELLDGPVMSALRDRLLAHYNNHPTIADVEISGRSLVVVVDQTKGTAPPSPSNFDVQISWRPLHPQDPSIMMEG